MMMVVKVSQVWSEEGAGSGRESLTLAGGACNHIQDISNKF